MKGAWHTAPLGELVVEIIDRRGVTPLKLGSKFLPVGYRVISAKAIKSGRVDLTADDPRFVDSATYMKWMRTPLAADDVLLTSEAPLGETAYLRAPVELCLGQRLFGIRTRKDIVYGRFLYYALKFEGVRQDLLSRATGTTAQGIRQSELRHVRIPLPSLREQHAIANLLGALDDKIDLNRRMAEALEALGRILFKSWFVDFDPVRSGAEERGGGTSAWPFPSHLEHSESGTFPKGWMRAPLAHWVTALSGGTPSKRESGYWGGPIPWISPKVMTSIHADQSEQFVTASAVGNGTRLAPAGSTLVMVRGMGLHQGVRVSQARCDLTFNQDVKALVGTLIEPTLLLFALLDAQRALLERVESSGHGTGVLPSGVLFDHPVTMPDPTVQQRLAEPFRSINERLAVTRTESKSLTALRDGLLTKLFAREIRIRDPEREVAAV